MKPNSLKLLILAALTLSVVVVGTQVLSSESFATAPSVQAAAVAPVAQATQTTGELTVDMSTWRETGFVVNPVSVSRPRRR